MYLESANVAPIIFFDNDGVLVDTESLFFRACAEVLASAGFVLEERVFQEVSLRQGRSVLDLLGPEVGVEARRALRDRRNLLFEQYLSDGDHRMEGVTEVLGELARSWRLAVVTSCLPRHFDAVHARSGLRPYFEFVIAHGDYARSKPCPDPYLVALDRAGVDASDAVVVEDSERGVRAAQAAGLRCIAMPGRLTGGGDFSSASAVVSGLREVPAALAGL